MAEQSGPGSDPPPATQTDFVPDRSPADPLVSTHIGPYKLLSLLGEGGFGVVYLAEQTKPVQRRVALKVIKPGMDSSAVLARFEAEEQALALMDHPNVAQVYDAGITDAGRPYFVMELVTGVPITEHCDRHRLSINERLGLFMQVCQAVQHAHQKGIIHRDIKPTNILVSAQDVGVAPALGVAPVSNRCTGIPKVIDFGVAKAISQPLTDRTLFTEQGQPIGTPAYMSPEQAERTAQDVDTRTDIYSLGVLLYELLTGALPLDPASMRQAAFDEILRIIREVEPQKPSTKLSSVITAGGDDSTTSARNRRADPRKLTRDLRGDLDWITMKALEKDRTRRYATASDFAADIQRHLSHEPVVAGPPSAGYRVSKFVRRNRGVVVGTGVIALVLMVATVVSIRFALSEAEQRALAVQNAATAEAEAETATRVLEFLVDLFVVSDPSEARGNTITAREMLDRGAARIRTELVDRPEVQATLMNTIGVVYESLGLYDAAVPLMESALKVRREIHGDDHLDVAESLYNLGLLFYRKHDIGPAEPLHREALRIRRQLLGDEHAEVGISLNALALVAEHKGDFPGAERLYREALLIFRKEHGDQHPDTLTLLNNMGVLLQTLGKHEEALRYFREALDRRRRVLGDDHPHTLISIGKMGALLEAMGKLKEAAPYVREALEGSRRVLGNDHPDTLTSIGRMGFLLRAMGKYEEALRYQREELQGSRRVLGNDHRDTLNSINNMGFLLQSMGKLKEAEPYLREAAESGRRVRGNDHPDTLVSISNLARLLVQIGKAAEGERLAREAVERGRATLGETHWLLGNFLGKLGFALTALKQYDDAETTLVEGHRILVATLDDEHQQTTRIVGYLADLYAAWHESEPDQGHDAKATMWRAKLPEEDGD